MKRLGVIFPGQGSQKQGMLSAYAESVVVRETIDEGSQTLGFDLWTLIQDDPENQLNKTAYTQPALLATSIALWRHWGGRADALAGHSLGEYSALVAAQALSYPEALQLVRARGEYMQAAVKEGEGAMAAVLGLSRETLEAHCQQQDGVYLANINSPGQIVIAGQKGPVNAIMETLKAAGAKRVLPLPVSVPSHTPLMAPAANALKEKILSAHWQTPIVPVYQNIHGQSSMEVEALQTGLVDQLTRPVEWIKVVETMGQQVDQWMECGPGMVLSGLVKRILPEMEVLHI